MRVLTLTACLTLLSASATGMAADSTAASNFDPHESFAPFRYQDSANSYRSASGVPAPAYWQNRASYKISATLDPVSRKLSGSEVITYSNNSPDPLDVLWLQLEQDRFRRDARGAYAAENFPTEFTDRKSVV